VAGYHTEYSGIKFAMFFLAEYLHMVTVSAVAVTLFLGGWHGPQFSFLPWLWPVVWFAIKLFVLLYVFIWIRATVPRFRYDRLMSFGWKVLIPVGLLWILITAAAVILPEVYAADRFGDLRAAVIIAFGAVAVVITLWPLFTGPPRGVEPDPGEVSRP
jgi:NADH-quinone oxidoreductase subunit H